MVLVQRSAVTRPIYQLKAEFFKTLAHPARIRVLELLRSGEKSVSELIPGVGLEPSHLSQQLGALRRANLIRARKERSSVYYSVTDPRIFQLLEVARAILTSSLEGTQDLLAELTSLDFAEPTSPSRSRKSRRPA